MKHLFKAWLIFVITANAAYSQAIFTRTFTGTGACPTQDNPALSGTGWTSPAVARNVISCNSTANVFNSTTLNNTASVNTNSYIEFSISAAAGYELNLTSVSFLRQASASAPNQFRIRFSTDGFVTNTDFGSNVTSPTTGSIFTWTFGSSIISAGTVTFRIYPYGTVRADGTAGTSSSSGTFRIDDLTLSGSVNATASPIISVSPASFTGFAATQGTASASQSYTLSGSNLSPASGSIAINAPTGYQVSTDNSNFFGSVNVSYSSSTLPSTTLYTRISSSASPGLVSGTITNIGGGATTQNVAVSGNVCPIPSGTFSVGDISIVGFSSDAPDQFAFVNWVAIPAGTQLSFTDNAWTGSALNNNENNLEWQNNTGSAIPAGTVVVVNDPSGGTGTIPGVADLGSVLSGNLSGLSASNDNIFIYIGTATCPEFIYGFSNTAWINTGVPNTNNSYLPSVLNVTNGNLVTTSSLDNWEYSASRNNQIVMNNYVPLVNNNANWSGNDVALTLSSVDFILASLPSLTLTPTGLSAFSTTAGTASASQSYTLSGSNLTPSSGNITVTAPTGYEVSADNISFSASLNVPYSSFTLPSTTLYTRIAAMASSGSPTGNITHAGGGATTQNLSVSGTVCPLPSGTFSVGDINLIGFGSDDPDQVAFVNWTPIPAGTQLRFTDNAWTGTTLKTNENTLVWENNTGNAINSGTVIVLSGTPTVADMGNVVSSNLNGLSTSNDNVFVYLGTPSCPQFIHGFSNSPWITSGTPTNSNSYLPAVLNVTNGNLVSSSSLDNWQYNGSRNNQTSFATYKAMVNNPTNYAGSDNFISLSSVDFTLIPVWNGSVSSSWTTAANWSENTLPTATQSPVIPDVSSLGNFFPNIGSSVSVNNLEVQPGASLTLGNGGALTVSGTLTNNGTITLQDGGALLQGTSSTLAGTGMYSVKRNLPTNDRFHFIGSPVNNAGVSDFGIVPFVINGSNGSQVVPLSTCDATAIDPASPWSNLLELRETAPLIQNCSQSLWHVKSAGTLENARGYAAMASGASTQNLSFNGTVNNGNVSYGNLGNSGGSTPFVNNPGTGLITLGWHLVSNPYPSPITLGTGNATLTGMGFDAQVQVWNSALNTWVPSVSNAVLPVAQGFQIRNSGSTALTFTATNAMRTPTTATFYDMPWEQYLTVTLENTTHTMQTVIFFHEDATDGYDGKLEANRLFGDPEVPVIYTLAGGDDEKMSFNGYAPLFNETKTVPMGVYDGGTPGNFSLRFQDLNTLTGTTVVLEDTKLNTFTPVNEGDVYTFNTEADDEANRFRVHFNMLDDTQIGTQTQSLFSVFPNPAEDMIQVAFGDEAQGYTLQLRDLSGKSLLSREIASGTQNVQIDTRLFASGVYLLEVRSASGERNVMKIIRK